MSEIIYGYCRVSTVKQKIERQIENIKREYPEAIIVQDQYTGTTSNRPNWNKLYKQVIDRADKGDKITIVFDEVSRMSRNVDDGMTLYQQMFDKGIELVFIKEPHINTSVYRNKLNEQIKKQNHADNNAAEKLIDTIIVALHEYTIEDRKSTRLNSSH